MKKTIVLLGLISASCSAYAVELTKAGQDLALFNIPIAFKEDDSVSALKATCFLITGHRESRVSNSQTSQIKNEGYLYYVPSQTGTRLWGDPSIPSFSLGNYSTQYVPFLQILNSITCEY